MKAEIKITKEVDIAKIVISVKMRYVGDSDDDDVPADFPGLKGNDWLATVDVDTGKIEGWPAGDVRDLYTKVCDEGRYTLYDRDGNSVAMLDGYVPNGIVPGEYGDYIDLHINADGVITNWPESPDISAFFEDEE